MVELDQATSHGCCHTWVQACKACGKKNHFERVCQSKGNEKWGAIQYIKNEEAAMDAHIAHVVSDPATDNYKPGNNNGCEEAQNVPYAFVTQREPLPPVDLLINGSKGLEWIY